MNPLSKQYKTYNKQVILLKMMKDVDKLFKNERIEYSLCGGRLLGAIRENGFIPWDDDIDIMVDRKNYNLIKELFNSEKIPCDFTLNRYLWIDRIQRIEDAPKDLNSPTIDIFVMDNCPDGPCLRRIKVGLIKILQGMMKEKQDYNKHSLPYRICLQITELLGKPFSDERKYNWYQLVSKIGNRKKTEYITGYNDAYNLLNCRYSGRLMDTIIDWKFEDSFFPVTAEFDNYLSVQYGDYMTPPPPEERIPDHPE